MGPGTENSFENQLPSSKAGEEEKNQTWGDRKKEDLNRSR